MVDSVNIINNKYYPQTLSENYKYKIKNDRIKGNINYDFGTSSYDESDSETDSESDNESNNESDNNRSDNNKSDNEYEKSSKNVIKINLLMSLKSKTLFY